jgi:epoxide hydrolase-like predicted phosphatase
MIKGVIFDVGGVLLRTYDPSGRRKWEMRLGLEPGSLAGLVFDSDLGRKAQLGQAAVDEVWSWLGTRLNLNSEELANLKHDFWAGDRVDQSLCDYIRELRRRYRTGMLSNTWAPDGRAMAEHFGFADCFDAFVTSAELGVMKPDARIYHVMLERLELKSPEVVFVDDFIQNVEAARRLGMQAVHFSDPASARSELQSWLGE